MKRIHRIFAVIVLLARIISNVVTVEAKPITVSQKMAQELWYDFCYYSCGCEWYCDSNTPAIQNLYQFILDPYIAYTLDEFDEDLGTMQVYYPEDTRGAKYKKSSMKKIKDAGVNIYDADVADALLMKYYNVTYEQIEEIHNYKGVYKYEEDTYRNSYGYYDNGKYYVVASNEGFGDMGIDFKRYEVLKDFGNNKFYIKFTWYDVCEEFDGIYTNYYHYTIAQWIGDENSGHWKIFALSPNPIQTEDYRLKALNTDIVAYVNHFAVPSYVVEGTSVVVAEDLWHFGIDATWDGNSRTLTLTRNNSVNSVNKMEFKKEGKPSTVFRDIMESDIKVFANGKRISSYNINGYTMIPIEELTMFGEVVWVPEQRAIKLWIEDGLEMSTVPQKIEQYSMSETHSAKVKQSIVGKYGVFMQGHTTGMNGMRYISVDSINDNAVHIAYGVEDFMGDYHWVNLDGEKITNADANDDLCIWELVHDSDKIDAELTFVEGKIHIKVKYKDRTTGKIHTLENGFIKM